MWIDPIDKDEFLQVVIPALGESDADALAALVKERWSPPQLCRILHNQDVDVRKVACVVLGLVGDDQVSGCLSAALRDEDPQVGDLAANALWLIWFRGGNGPARRCFREGLAAMEREDPAGAVPWFGRAAALDPRFGEADNQRAVALYLLEQWDAAIDASEQALARVPHHFGAAAGIGHCYAQRGDLREAARYYRRALAINPRMDLIAEALDGIERCVQVA
ncbi:MAG: tetratricopeptide repeat protein [Phycisphaerae bacterium]|nr:tetratricopeptide repeat protein [Phycisphaerae bacterium]